MKVAIIGGGAAGLFCAANLHFCDVTIFESTLRCGNKLLLTGGGRCNLTSLERASEFLESVPHGSKFLMSCLFNFSPFDLVAWFEERGLKTKVENKRVFPESDSSADVLNLLLLECSKNGTKIEYGKVVDKIKRTQNGFVVAGQTFDRVVVATGGKSFSKTGSCGLGNVIAKHFGIKTQEFEPKLTPIFAKGTKPLMGLSARVGLEAKHNGAPEAKQTGDVVFTHFGISGPAALDLSSKISGEPNTKIIVDFLPQLSEEQIKQKILEIRKTKTKAQSSNVVNQIVPERVADQVLEALDLQTTKAADLSSLQMEEIAYALKHKEFEFVSLGNFNNAWVSRGGIKTEEINPKSMESKTVPGLYFVGEAIDVDGLCGGFNLQIAFSTAFAAAQNIEAIK